MLRTRRRNAILCGVAATAASFLIAPRLAGVDYGWVTGAAYGTLQWQDSDGADQESGLFLIEHSPYGNVRRVLAAHPDDEWRAVSTYMLDGVTGREVLELVDDKSGWSARAEIRYGIEAETLAAFFERAGYGLSSEDQVELRLSTNQGVEEVLRIPATEPDFWAAFARDLSPDQASRIAHSIPADFRPGVIFLDDCLKRWLGVAGDTATEPREPTDLIRVLADALRRTFPEAQRWAVEPDARRLAIGPNHRGSGIVEPEILELTARFQSVENADPLARHHVEEVTGPGARQGED